MKTFFQFTEDVAKRKQYELTRHEDDSYQTSSEKLQNPRLRKLRKYFNREVGKYTV